MRLLIEVHRDHMFVIVIMRPLAKFLFEIGGNDSEAQRAPRKIKV